MEIRRRFRRYTQGIELLIRQYTQEEKERENTGLGFRCFLAALIFCLFVAMDQSKERIAAVDSKRIVQGIEQNADWEKELQEISCKIK